MIPTRGYRRARESGEKSQLEAKKALINSDLRGTAQAKWACQEYDLDFENGGRSSSHILPLKFRDRATRAFFKLNRSPFQSIFKKIP